MERITCCNLGKKYKIGEREPYKALRDVFMESLSRSAKQLQRFFSPHLAPASSNGQNHIWAIKNISFSVKAGEAVGVIGRNGAGKTTLLKILSRITEPTEGSVRLRGQLGSLLEVGTGFHPELTGRENIFFNGAILGMKKNEIRKKFDEIVAFAEIEKFIDTPVKRYSSGMYLRLAFAVAAHLEPQILLVDEVLAVGDYNFQKKCLGKMEEIGAAGRTILFVSHSMPSILRLCERVICLDKGKLIADGEPHQVVGSYLRSGLGTSAERLWEDIHNAPGDDIAKLHSIRVCDKEGRTQETIDIRQPVGIEVKYWKQKPDSRPFANLHFTNEEGVQLFISSELNNSLWQAQSNRAGMIQSTCWIPGNFLAEGRIIVLAAVSTLEPTIVHAIEQDAVSFQVIDKSKGDGVRGKYGSDLPGVIRPMLEWDYHFKNGNTPR